MKRVLILCLCLTAIFSCKKEKKASDLPLEVQPVKTGRVILRVNTYDSLGMAESDRSGVKVSLGGTSFTAVTGPDGRVVFNNVPYGDILPVLVKDSYDGLPVIIALNADSVSSTLPFAKQSPYKVVGLTGDVTDKNLITISFSLNKNLINSTPCKVAVLSSGSGTITNSVYQAADTITVFSQNTVNLNVALLPNLRAAVEGVNNNYPFKICVTALSYGMLYSNVTGRQNLLGDNLYYPNNLTFTKTWQ